ncbi:MAG: hypothetical protein DLM59_00615 [Pseudonocardiales bacterium]|nr:MAG: hypothetical protein DLM59_00615 [Pseudonocardiales bacterium]
MPPVVRTRALGRSWAGTGPRWDGQHEEVAMRTGRLGALLVTATLPAVLVFAVRHHQPPAPSPAAGPAPGPVLVGSVALSTTSPAPGVAVVATVTIRADRRLSLDGMTVAVRDEGGRPADAAGRSYDFPSVGAMVLGTSARTLTFAHRYRTPGAYVYFLEYRSGGGWQPLAPYASFIVG